MTMATTNIGYRPGVRALAWTAALLMACAAMSPAGGSVFGDGRADNGVEDDRQPIGAAVNSSPRFAGWSRSAGTITCDGRRRGSAVIVDPGETGRALPGFFIATAAHVLVDLSTATPFVECRFHHMGLEAAPGYAAELRRTFIVQGLFDPKANRTDPSFGHGDWAFAYLEIPWAHSGSARGLPLVVTEAAGRTLGLIAWNDQSHTVALSYPCRAVESGPGDLGGGAWPGQWLDDCDSGPGASGGAVVARVDGRDALVAIRGGEHWNPGDHGVEPAPGGRWDLRGHTNYARALDLELIRAFHALVQRIPQPHAVLGGAESSAGRRSSP